MNAYKLYIIKEITNEILILKNICCCHPILQVIKKIYNLQFSYNFIIIYKKYVYI